MTIDERAKALVGDMPWVTEHLTPKQLADLPDQIETCIRVAVEDEMRLALAEIEEMAEERHLLHSSLGNGDRFWGCSKSPCRRSAEFLRGKIRPFCKARAAGTAGGNDPQDCDWPWCHCDPVAGRVLAAIQEQGLEIVRVKEATRSDIG